MAAVSEMPLQKRRSSIPLPPLVIPPRNEGDRVPVDDDLVEEGKELFSNFVLEDIRRDDDSITVAELTAQISTPAGYKNPLWAKTGRELRFMADEFAKTKEREKLARKAAAVDINSVTFEQFQDLLAELFLQGAFTKERVMVLFCFCSDLAVRGLTFGTEVCRQVVSWSTRFITETVCSVIQTLGGWSKVLCRNGEVPVGYVVVASIAIIGTVLVMRYLNK